ncbi:hypothetical protein Nmel_013944, partial [Mimus melanotis]
MLLFTKQNLIHPFPYITTQLSSFPTQRLLWLSFSIEECILRLGHTTL